MEIKISFKGLVSLEYLRAISFKLSYFIKTLEWGDPLLWLLTGLFFVAESYGQLLYYAS